MARSETMDMLRKASVFSGLSESDLAEFSGIVVDRSLEPEEYVFWEGDAPVWFYLVGEGKVKVFKHSSSGKEFIVAFFGPGEMFGEVAVFEDRAYPASAQAVAPSRVLGIRREDFISFFAERPEVALKIVIVLGGRLRDAQSRLKDIAGERVEQRIASLLVMLHSKVGSEIPFTRQEIAEMAGTTTETAIRVMSRLGKDGIIRSVRGKTMIRDEGRLRLLSEGPSQAHPGC